MNNNMNLFKHITITNTFKAVVITLILLALVIALADIPIS